MPICWNWCYWLYNIQSGTWNIEHFHSNKIFRMQLEISIVDGKIPPASTFCFKYQNKTNSRTQICANHEAKHTIYSFQITSTIPRKNSTKIHIRRNFMPYFAETKTLQSEKERTANCQRTIAFDSSNECCQRQTETVAAIFTCRSIFLFRTCEVSRRCAFSLSVVIQHN